MNWKALLGALEKRYKFHTGPPPSADVIEQVFSDLQFQNEDFKAFYRVTNGLSYDWFSVLPIEDPKRIKHTWDGIKRANDHHNDKRLRGGKELLTRFLVFSRIGGGNVAVIERTTGAIWYEEQDDLHRTDASLAEYIEVCLKEVAGI